MATKEEIYDPVVNYDSDPEELNNRWEKNGCSPPSSPVDNVYLTGEFIYNDVGSGWRCGGPMADNDPENRKEQNKEESKDLEKEGSTAQAKPEGKESESSSAKVETEKKECIYCESPIQGHPWSGSGFLCHTGKPWVDIDHDQFCEKCAKGAPDRLRNFDKRRGVMTCPKHGKRRKAAIPSDSKPDQV